MEICPLPTLLSHFQKCKFDQVPPSYVPKSESILPLTPNLKSSKGSQLPKEP